MSVILSNSDDWLRSFSNNFIVFVTKPCAHSSEKAGNTKNVKSLTKHAKLNEAMVLPPKKLKTEK